MTTSSFTRCARAAILGASLLVLVAACGSDVDDPAQVAAGAPTSVPTTAPLAAPTASAVPTPTPTAAPATAATPIPEPTVAAAAPPSPTLAPAPSPSPAAAPAPTAAPTATAEAVETPTPLPTPIPTATSEATSPTAVAVSGEPPLECYDPGLGIYRGFVDGVDTLAFSGGRVSCTEAATNRVSAPRSYRHSSDLVVSRNNDFIFNSAGTGYINYSGAIHFCLNGQPGSAPFQAATIPLLLIVIDNTARSQVAQGATGPASFTSSGAQC